MAYSQGVRQALNRMFGPGGPYAEGGPKHRKDFMIMGPAREYLGEGGDKRSAHGQLVETEL